MPLQLPELCQGQLAVSVESHTGRVLDCTAVQTPGLLDDLFYTDEPLGAHYCPDTKQHRISVWVSVRRKVHELRREYIAVSASYTPYVRTQFAVHCTTERRTLYATLMNHTTLLP